MKKFLHLAANFFVVVLFATFVSKPAQALTCSSVPSNTGTDITTVSLPAAGTYKIWSRIKAPDTTNNAYYVQIDSQCPVVVGDSSAITPNVWTWVDYQNGNSASKITMSLGAGNHAVKLVGKESNVGVDKLVFASDLSCVPSGTGANCGSVSTLPTPTVTPVPTSVPGATKIQLQLFLHGIGKGGDNANTTATGNFSLMHPQRQVTIDLYNGQNQLLLSKAGTVSFVSTLGGFTGIVDMGTTVTTGNYLVKIKSPQYLTTLVNGIQTIAKGATFQLPKTTLISGDISNDNTINVLDFNILTGCYSDLTPAQNCTAASKLAADLNDDGNVNQFDYNLFIRELTTRGGQ